MNDLYDVAMKCEDVLRVELDVFRSQHRELKRRIDAMQEALSRDQIMLQRLKREKLMLKDRIALIEDRLTPDIIA